MPIYTVMQDINFILDQFTAQRTAYSRKNVLYYVPTDDVSGERSTLFLSVPETNPNIFQVWRNDFPEEKNLTLAIFTGSKIPQTILQSVSCSMAATFHRTVVELVFTLSQVQ